MKYDFTTMINRSNKASAKWQGMEKVIGEQTADIFPFSTADLDFVAVPALKAGLLNFIEEDGVFGYTEADECYLECVCRWMEKSYGWSINKEWIECSPGVVPAIYAAIEAYSEVGDGVIVFTPVYFPFFEAIEDNGRVIVDCPLIDKDAYYDIDFAAFEEQARDPKNKILIFCSPHNPIGRVWKEEELRKVLAICKQNDVLLIADEIHADLIMPTHRHLVAADLDPQYRDMIVTCTAPSKTFNMAGLQVANIIISDEGLRERFVAAQRKSGFYSLNSLGYKACELVYEQGGSWLAELLVLINDNYRVLQEFLKNEFPEVELYPMEGTYLAWMDWSDANTVDKIIKEARVYVERGERFKAPRAGFIRMNIACPTAGLQAALARIKTALKD